MSFAEGHALVINENKLLKCIKISLMKVIIMLRRYVCSVDNNGKRL